MTTNYNDGRSSQAPPHDYLAHARRPGRTSTQHASTAPPPTNLPRRSMYGNDADCVIEVRRLNAFGLVATVSSTQQRAAPKVDKVDLCLSL
jgi:hypothetical protein